MSRFGTFRLSLIMAASLLPAAVTAAPAAAGTSIDPNTLFPPPPPGAECSHNGRQTICRTVFNVFLTNEPILDVPCGTVYETSSDLRVGIRWYDEDGKLVRRHVFADLEGTWTLSPTGDGPAVRVAGHSNWSDDYLIPGDESSSIGSSRGEYTVHLQGHGGAIHIAGRDAQGEYHGVFRAPDDPAVGPLICEALTA
jgi:hypothetical protein